MIKSVDVERIESELFNNVTNLTYEYKQVKNELNRQLGVDLKRIPAGQVLLSMEYENKFMPITSGTMADMKEWVKKYNGKNFKLSIKANTWTLRVNY